MVGNGTQYTNYLTQLKTKFTQRQASIHLFGLITQYNNVNFFKIHLAAIKAH